MSTKTTQAPLCRLPSPPAHTAEEVEEDELWEKANGLFPDPDLPDLADHPREGPGLYILDQQSRGLIPRSLLQNPEAAVAALANMFRDTFDEPNALQIKAEQAYGTLAARKMVDEQVRPSPSLSCFAYKLQPARFAFMSSCSALMPALFVGSGASARAGCDDNAAGVPERLCHY
jgi:hypothetical protein